MKDSLSELLQKLKTDGKEVLANTISNFGNLSIKEYSEKLWTYSSNISFEPALKEAFRKEFDRVGIEKFEQEKILISLEKYRTVQTAPHTGFHDSARLLTSHSIALASIPEDAYYVCATFSGIPYGNDSYPGALTFTKKYDFRDIIENAELIKEAEKKQSDRERDLLDDGYNRLSLYPARDRDMLVYKSTTNEVYKKYFPTFKSPIKDILKNDESITKNMLYTNQKIFSQIFPNKKIICVDKNEIVSNYLQIVLRDKEHFMYKIFFDKDMHEKIIKIFSTDEHFFYHSREDGTSERGEHAYIENFVLKSKSLNEEITPDTLIDKLKNGKLCPGIFVGFTIFAFLNGFQCFGSFKQVGYLTLYKNMWLENNLLPFDIKNVVTNSLTTGGIPDEKFRKLTPIDILLGSEWKVDNKEKFGEYLLAIKDVLLAFKN